MALITDQLSLLNFVYTGNYTGQSTNSLGTADLTTTLVNLIKIPFTQDTEVNTTVNVTTGYNVYYKMQGYNPITQKYEDWHSMDAPLMDPPSGHTLENISIVGTWIDR